MVTPLIVEISRQRMRAAREGALAFLKQSPIRTTRKRRNRKSTLIMDGLSSLDHPNRLEAGG